MKQRSNTRHLLGTASAVALSVSAILASSGTPASAAASSGLYFGGSTLASEAFRQIFDCYTGATVGGDTFSFSTSFNSATPTPGLLPTGCTVVSTVQGMYAGVGSGNGVRGFISNSPSQWYNGTVTPPATLTPPPLPAAQPPFVDSLNAAFGSYPYPRVDVGLSDSPLAATLAALTTTSITFSPATGWNSTSTVTASGNTTATYNTTVFGKAVQIPAFEVNVAIAVNTSTLTVKSAVAKSSTTQGAAIQLTTGQLCAIFSGLVTDWNDVTLNKIPYLDSAGTQHLAAFNYANADASGVLQPYATTSTPIHIAYRSDGSGTSFIITNYLKAVCPLLDPSNTFGYQSIFNQANLPSTTFANLITNITTLRGSGAWNAPVSTSTTQPYWIPASGSAGVASSVNDGAASAGAVGYVSADFTRPYTTQVSSLGAPYSAALQNEQLRITGVDVPNNANTTSLTFIAPTPAAADAAWNDTRLQAPKTTWTWNDYNIYSNTFTTPVVQGGITLSGQSVLPLTNVQGAYPASGTTFMDLYSCYSVAADANRVNNLRNFLSWYMNGAGTVAQSVVENNGFHLLPPQYSSNIVTEYLTSGNNIQRPNYIQASGASPTNGCAGVTGGGAL